MKRKVTALLTALLLTLTLCVPTLAWTEYGAIYDETDALGSDELSDLGQYTLSQLTEGVHLHTLSCPDEQAYRQLTDRLRQLGFLAE